MGRAPPFGSLAGDVGISCGIWKVLEPLIFVYIDAVMMYVLRTLTFAHWCVINHIRSTFPDLVGMMAQSEIERLWQRAGMEKRDQIPAPRENTKRDIRPVGGRASVGFRHRPKGGKR